MFAALGDRAIAITHDPHRNLWRELHAWERANLTCAVATRKRGARWPLQVRIRGRAERLLGRRSVALPENSGLVVPEVFSPAVARALPELGARAHGPRVAVFHDAIALKVPELTPRSTVARFPPYLIELLGFEGIAAVSEDSRASLLDYWRWLGLKKFPAVTAIPLGSEPQHWPRSGEISPSAASPVVLSVGSIEGRKNHLALLQACEELWQRGEHFQLHLIGLVHATTGAAALAKLRALQAAGRPLRFDGPVSDADVDAAYAACTFTVYPSLMEGFGLPVIESLRHGKPCVCSAHGAIGESARGGGCVGLDRVDAPALAAAITRLIHSPTEVAALAQQARARRFRSWNDYAGELIDWMRQLPGDPRTGRRSS